MPDIIPFPGTRRSKRGASTSPQKKLNIGCGKRFDARWVNLDIDSNDASVIVHDATAGLPFETATFDVVYHSHVLEHLEPHLGRAMMQDCHRILKPDGILRVVVPDLEKIADLYLQMHQRAWEGDETAAVDYNWIKLEMLDQLVRSHSGGRMGRYMSSPEIKNSDFVRSRVGDEFHSCRMHDPDRGEPRKIGWAERMGRRTLHWRRKVAREVTRLLLGRSGARAFDEGLFRSRGEIHRWMYDRYSLKSLCYTTGFCTYRVCSAFESDIDGFEGSGLDSVDGRVRKPDSLFIECRKPAEPASVRRAA